MYCVNCGAEIQEGQVFCGKCGVRIVAQSKNEQNKQKTDSVTNSSEWSNPSSQFSGSSSSGNSVYSTASTKKENRAYNTEKQSGKGLPKPLLMILLVGIVIISLIASLIISLSGHRGKTDETPVSVATEQDKNAIAMINVQGKMLSEAVDILSNSGFKNVVSNVGDDPDWDVERWVVVDQSAHEGDLVNPDEQVQLIVKKLCHLYLDLSSEYNLLLNTYDMEIALDNSQLGTVSNGELFTTLVDVIEGDHELLITKAGNSSVEATGTIHIDGDMTYKCDISHSSSISFKNISTIAGTQSAALEMPDCVGMVLADAKNLLKDIGFVDIQSHVEDDSVWDDYNWIVTSQSLSAGSIEDKAVPITLSVIKIDTYLEEHLTGLALSEAANNEFVKTFSIKYINVEENNEIDVNSIDSEAKERWTIDHARLVSGSEKTISIYMNYNPTPEEKAAAAIEVPDCTGMILSSARTNLSDLGFKNIKSYVENDAVWDENNWLVTAQNIAAGTKEDKSTEIILTVIKLDNYLNENLTGLTLAEAEKSDIAKEFTIKYVDSETSTEIDTSSVENDAKGRWEVLRVGLINGSTKTASAYMKYNPSPEEIAAAAIEVPDCTGMILSSARTCLSDLGFKNIKSYAENDTVWDEKNWLVTEQNIAAGSKEDKSTEIILTVIKLDTYLNESLAGLTLAEAEESDLAKEFTIKYIDSETSSEVDTSAIENDAKTRWEVLRARLVSGSDKTISVYMKYNPTPEEIAAAAIEVPDCIGMILSSARTYLSDLGFKNIKRYAENDSVWDEDNWLVTEQNIAAGSKEDKSTEIILTVVKLDTYLNKNLTGLTLAEAEKSDITKEFTIKYINNETSTEVDTSSVENDAKDRWEIIRVGSISGSTKTASVYMKYNPTPEEIAAMPILMPNCIGMILVDAENMLKNAGFTNVSSYVENDAVQNNNNWIVTDQNVSAGTETKRSTDIVLTVLKLDKYLNSNLTGLTVSEVERSEIARVFKIIYRDAESTDEIDINSIEYNQRKNWIVESAKLASGKDRTAYANIAYHQPEEPVEVNSSANSVSYSTNNRETAKEGNQGVFSYKIRGGTYTNYYIINFDEGYVYHFTDGNGEETSDRVAIDFGDLNSGVIVTYHDGDTKWSYMFSFANYRQPEHAKLIDNDGFTTDLYFTDLDDALAKLATKKIVDY